MSTDAAGGCGELPMLSGEASEGGYGDGQSSGTTAKTANWEDISSSPPPLQDWSIFEDGAVGPRHQQQACKVLPTFCTGERWTKRNASFPVFAVGLFAGGASHERLADEYCLWVHAALPMFAGLEARLGPPESLGSPGESLLHRFARTRILVLPGVGSAAGRAVSAPLMVLDDDDAADSVGE
ncbi:hypothetical protein DOTSEDRAFT_30259 [Dothistroma septosporum NZE10]|uniref:Uncharacterized protein n=1 Tax=Dothistroma septosporum (strain NZE10 / CBS 128990) TaxID=675120 RepID=N1PZN8_DOTSN|nr:hypothetical protein DOTSEDRAFT_30259 [Dothistroma septosporum NZE10]